MGNSCHLISVGWLFLLFFCFLVVFFIFINYNSIMGKHSGTQLTIIDFEFYLKNEKREGSFATLLKDYAKQRKVALSSTKYITLKQSLINYIIVNDGIEYGFNDKTRFLTNDSVKVVMNLDKVRATVKAVEQVIIPPKKEEPPLPEINTEVINTNKIKQQVISILDNTIGAYADSLKYVRVYLDNATKNQKVDKEERQVFRDVIDGMNSITKASSNVIDMITKVE